MKKSLLLCLIICLPFVRSGAAQSVGSPLKIGEPAELTFSLNGGFDKKTINGIKHESPRILLKAIYGLSNVFELFGEIGIAKLNIRPSGQKRPAFRDGTHLALGAGFTIRFLHFERSHSSLFLNTRFFRFTSSPVSKTTLNTSLSNILQIQELDYDSREFDLNFGLTKRMRFLKVYFGINNKWISRLEKRTGSTVVGGVTESSFSENGEYQSGAKFGPYLGFDVQLPSHLNLSFEGRMTNESDFFINFGLSQTGSPNR
ncbi:MAG: hypothetical protein ACE5IR_03370 [bacterium]